MNFKTFLFAAMLLTLGVFVACGSDEEYDETFANNEKFLKSSFEESTIAPLNTIPLAVRNKMSAKELETFTKMSSVFYMDYSFLDSAFYQDNKDVILQQLTDLYSERIATRNTPTYFTLLSHNSSKLSKGMIASIGMSVSEEGSDYNIVGTYNYNGCSLGSDIVCVTNPSGGYGMGNSGVLRINPSYYTFSPSLPMWSLTNKTIAFTVGGTFVSTDTIHQNVTATQMSTSAVLP